MRDKLVILLILYLIFVGFTEVYAQQLCTPEAELTASSLLDIAQIYESGKEWDKAIEIYGQVAVSPCQVIASEGQQGLQRALAKKNNWFINLGKQLQTLGFTVVSKAVLIAFIFIIVFIVIKIVLHKPSRSDKWSVRTFNDLTNQKLGDDVAELIVNTLHEIRFWHSKEATGLISLSENIDLPSFSGITHSPSMLMALSNLETLEVGGIELPFGSVISSLREWLDLDGYRVLGTIRQSGNNLTINARWETGRQNKCIRIWRKTATINPSQNI